MSIDLDALQEPITRILTSPGTDLSTISAKRVRKALLKDPAYAYLRLTPDMLKTQREDVDQVIARIFEGVNQAASYGVEDNGNGEREEGEGEGEEAGGADRRQHTGRSEVFKPPKKRSRSALEESDAALARKLSTEINSRSRRGTSSATSASSSRKARRKSNKSSEMVDLDDEDGEAGLKKRSVAKGGFAKEYTLSVPLSAVLAVEKLSRPQVVKKLWEYIRQHQLQNPSNRKEIICDSALRAVFSVDKIDMFRMNKVLGQHLHED